MTLNCASELTAADHEEIVQFREVALRLGGDVVIAAPREDLPEACWVTEPRSPTGSAVWVVWRTEDRCIYAEHLYYPTLNRPFDGMAAFCAWITGVWREAAEARAVKAL